MKKQLKVTGVRYFETRRGLGYECKTNINGLLIWNDGNGGGTFLDCDFQNMNRRELAQYEEEFSETDLEHLIDVYEGVDLINKYI
jgi:hypothetical protein